jgi:outer membrane protein assembly factor BamB
MTRHSGLFSIVTVLAALYSCAASAQTENKIISEQLAARHGLTRAWFTQVEMDAARSRLQDLVLYNGILYAQTDHAVVHAIDAETGATLWAKPIGRPDHPSMRPGIGGNLLAIVNGSRLYVADRLTGNILLETDINGAPGAGPAVSNERVYVPTVKGLLLSYRIEQQADPRAELAKENPISPDESAKPNDENRQNIRLTQQISKQLNYQSKGRALVQPRIGRQSEIDEYIIWPTDAGCMYIGRINRGSALRIEVLYRLETAAPITARPTYRPPDPDVEGDTGMILAATGDGYVHAISEKTGDTIWRFSAGEPLSQPAIAIDDKVFAATPLGGLHCINAKTGLPLWTAPGIVQFISAGKNRVYTADKQGLVRVLDMATGAQFDVLPTAALSAQMLNADTDRLYLATPNGLIQCLHEIDLVKPIVHDAKRKQAAEQAVKAIAVKKGEEKPAAENEAPEAAQEPAAKAAEMAEEPKDPFSE